MTVLLECARAVRPDVPPGPAEPGPAPARVGGVEPRRAPDAVAVVRPARDAAGGGHGRSGPIPDAVLSAREQEIARRVLTGLTYKEIGAQLFISAKTVEHHMARIRRRLGATSRRELFGQLQAMLNPDQATPHAS
jgi:DNA-binding CsgD family transcriptional regulator